MAKSERMGKKWGEDQICIAAAQRWRRSGGPRYSDILMRMDSFMWVLHLRDVAVAQGDVCTSLNACRLSKEGRHPELRSGKNRIASTLRAGI